MTYFFALLALISGMALWIKSGSQTFFDTTYDSLWLLLQISPILVLAMLVGGYVQVLVPKAFVQKWLGAESGLKGQLIATLAGAVTPGGPFAAFPMVLVLYQGGASFAICVNYLTAWSVLGINRILVWEIPFFDTEFIVLRTIASLPLALVAGYSAQWLFEKPGKSTT
ncbi:MAG: permease [Gammaproteobacteria bacterium]|nr:permease [Gammaproteobacteria bacterium]